MAASTSPTWPVTGPAVRMAMNHDRCTSGESGRAELPAWLAGDTSTSLGSRANTDPAWAPRWLVRHDRTCCSNWSNLGASLAKQASQEWKSPNPDLSVQSKAMKSLNFEVLKQFKWHYSFHERSWSILVVIIPVIYLQYPWEVLNTSYAGSPRCRMGAQNLSISSLVDLNLWLDNPCLFQAGCLVAPGKSTDPIVVVV